MEEDKKSFAFLFLFSLVSLYPTALKVVLSLCYVCVSVYNDILITSQLDMYCNGLISINVCDWPLFCYRTEVNQINFKGQTEGLCLTSWGNSPSFEVPVGIQKVLSSHQYILTTLG